MTDAVLSLPISVSLLIGTIGIHKLMSQVNADNQLLSILSQFDPLTNCLSRTETLYQLSNEIKRSLRTKKSFAVLELDIDHFKIINDQHGHNIGDEVLHSLAAFIKSLLRSNDHFGRVGGEEFVIILPDTDEQQARIIADRIREQVERKDGYSQSSAKPIKLTISVGICVAELAESNANIDDLGKALIKQADKAMYKAKNNGRNQISL
ncbi:GGDEF domain-containing protein [Polynucleobacter sp. MWH-UH2A]|uniref:GGDEF domain-containing protein n=1 Tax=Polynucleobacter sp. MWH-UH2A TaxID=1855617 RepID=UPI001BFED7AD|nr:GGDEF domain-containing protein [Polynucleobacter sp. MWH-UH2A]QWD63840.1 GGDEF domain-containing protein [Polynucleobacter sp. MWH-UH2A]